MRRKLQETTADVITILRYQSNLSVKLACGHGPQRNRNAVDAQRRLSHAASSSSQSSQGTQAAFRAYLQLPPPLQQQLAQWRQTPWKNATLASFATSTAISAGRNYMRLLPTEAKLAPKVALEVAITLRFWKGYCNYLLTFETANLPTWARTRLLDIPSGWSNFLAWLPREWALRPTSFEARVAIANAFAIVGGHVQRLTPVFIAEALRKNNFAYTLQGPNNFALASQLEEGGTKLSWLGKLWRGMCEALLDACRIAHLLTIFLPLACNSLFMLSQPRWRRRWMRSLRKALEQAGAAFIKWGQWAATRRDLFPPDLCQELEHLHACAPVHSMALTEDAIQRAFGAAYDELFDDFPANPMASGSIGQVYKARLSAKGARHTGIDPGTPVAVKVRHPGVEDSIQRDFALMMRVAQLAAWLPVTTGLHLEDTLKQFAGPLREQVDLSLEARHLWEFNYNFRYRRDVRFPFPIYPLVAPEVLVETFAEGDCISEYVKRGSAGRFNSRLAKLGSQTMLQMMLVDNLIHSDLHPGNILVALDPPKSPVLHLAAQCIQRFAPNSYSVPLSWHQPRIVLLDAGMATRLSTEDQQNMLHLFEAFSDQDGARIAAATLAFSGEAQTCPDVDGFIKDLDSRFNAIQAAQQKGEIRDGAEALGSLLELVRQHQVSLPGHICAVVVTTLVLEGWSSQLDPSHAVLSQVQQILAKKSSFAHRLVAAVDESFQL